MSTSPESRGLDPFNLIFPKLTKCSLNTYGPSGTIQTLDGLCILPVNVLNEKIYLVTWCLLMSLAVLTIVHHVISAVIILSPFLRKKVLALYLSKDRKDLRWKLNRILDMTSIGDWLMLFMLAKNTDRGIYSEVIHEIKYPDYRFDLDENDPENVELLNLQFQKCYI